MKLRKLKMNKPMNRFVRLYQAVPWKNKWPSFVLAALLGSEVVLLSGIGILKILPAQAAEVAKPSTANGNCNVQGSNNVTVNCPPPSVPPSSVQPAPKAENQPKRKETEKSNPSPNDKKPSKPETTQEKPAAPQGTIGIKERNNRNTRIERGKISGFDTGVDSENSTDTVITDTEIDLPAKNNKENDKK